MRRPSLSNVIGPVLLAGFAVIAVVGPLLVDFNPVAVNTRQRLLSPMSSLTNGAVAYLGTDQLGRDILAQILVGARTSLGIALAAAVIATLLGTAVGLAAGWAGGRVSEAIVRVIDVQLSFP